MQTQKKKKITEKVEEKKNWDEYIETRRNLRSSRK